MRLFYPALILALMAALFYRHFDDKYQKMVLTDTVERLEQEKTQIRDECETRIARLRFEYETQLSGLTSRSGPGALADIIQDARTRKQDDRQSAIINARSLLNLDEATFKKFVDILDNYDENKKKVRSLSISEGKPFFDQSYLTMLEDYKNKAIDQLEGILTREQMQSLMSDETHKNLGL